MHKNNTNYSNNQHSFNLLKFQQEAKQYQNEFGVLQMENQNKNQLFNLIDSFENDSFDNRHNCSFETQQNEIKIIKQKNQLEEIYYSVISEESINNIFLLKQLMNEINPEQFVQKTKNIVNNINQEVKQDLRSLIKDFRINNIEKQFELLFKFDNEFKKVLCLILKKIIRKALIYDKERVLLDTYMYLMNGRIENSLNYKPQKWLYGNQYLLSKIFEKIESKLQNQGSNFSRSPLNQIIQNIDIEVEEYMNLNNKLLEQTQQKNIFNQIDITEQFETQQLIIDQSQQMEIVRMVEQFEEEIQKFPQNHILVLILYKKIQLQWNSEIQQPIQNYKKSLIDQIQSNLNKLLPIINNQNSKIQFIELNQILDTLSIFINDYYLDFQIILYIQKIQIIIVEQQNQKMHKNEVIMEQPKSNNLIEILNLVPSNFKQEFQKIMTKNVVSMLKKYLKENKLTQVKEIDSQKQLLLIMCQQIGLKLFPDYFREESSIMIDNKSQFNDDIQQSQSYSQQLNQYKLEQNIQEQDINLEQKRFNNNNASQINSDQKKSLIDEAIDSKSLKINESQYHLGQNYFQNQLEENNIMNDSNNQNPNLNNNSNISNKVQHVPQFEQEQDKQIMNSQQQVNKYQGQKDQQISNYNTQLNEEIQVVDHYDDTMDSKEEVILLIADTSQEYQSIENQNIDNQMKDDKDLDDYNILTKESLLNQNTLIEDSRKIHQQGKLVCQEQQIQNIEEENDKQFEEQKEQKNAINNQTQNYNDNLQNIEIQIQDLIDKINNECNLERHTFQVIQELKTNKIKHKQHTIVTIIEQKQIIIETKMVEETYILTYDQNDFKSLNKISLLYENQNPKIIYISQQQQQIYLLLLQQQQQNQYQNFNHSPVGYFFYHFVRNNQPFNHQQNDSSTIINQLNQYFDKFQASLQFYLKVKSIYYTLDNDGMYIIPLNTKNHKVTSDKYELFILDQEANSLFYVQKNMGYQIYFTRQYEENNNHNFSQCKKMYCNWNSELEDLEFQELFKLSKFMVFQILITIFPPIDCQKYMDDKMRNYIIQQYNPQFGNYRIKYSDQLDTQSKLNQTFQKNIEKEYNSVFSSKTCLSVKIEVKYYKDVKEDKKSSVIVQNKYEQIFANIKSKQNEKFYFYIIDQEYNNSVIFNLSNDKQNQILSCLIIVNKSCNEINILQNLEKKYKMPEKKYIVVLHMQKNEPKIQECINLIVKVINSQHINESFFSYLLRDILLSNNEFLQNFIHKL